MEKKPKIIRDKSKDKVINEILKLLKTEEEAEERKKNKHSERIVKDRIIKDNRTLFEEEEEEEDYYETKRVNNFWNNNYIVYEGNDDENRNWLLAEYQLTIAINFISSKYAKEEHVMHSSSGNIKFPPYSDVNDVIDKLFKSFRSRYQKFLETSMKRSDLFSTQFN